MSSWLAQKTTVKVYPSYSRGFRKTVKNFSTWSFIFHLVTTIDFILQPFTPLFTEDILRATFPQLSQATWEDTKTFLRTMRGSTSLANGSKKTFSSFHMWEPWMWAQSCWTLTLMWLLTSQSLRLLTTTTKATAKPKLAAWAITRTQTCKTNALSLPRAKWQVALKWARLLYWFGRLPKLPTISI